jgi:ribose 1,5-bisphosphokinase PhnN
VVANSFASDVSTSGGTFTLSWHANGLFYIDYA